MGNSNQSVYLFVAILLSDCILKKNETKEYFPGFQVLKIFLYKVN